MINLQWCWITYLSSASVHCLGLSNSEAPSPGGNANVWLSALLDAGHKWVNKKMVFCFSLWWESHVIEWQCFSKMHSLFLYWMRKQYLFTKTMLFKYCCKNRSGESNAQYYTGKLPSKWGLKVELLRKFSSVFVLHITQQVCRIDSVSDQCV